MTTIAAFRALNAQLPNAAFLLGVLLSCTGEHRLIAALLCYVDTLRSRAVLLSFTDKQALASTALGLRIVACVFVPCFTQLLPTYFGMCVWVCPAVRSCSVIRGRPPSLYHTVSMHASISLPCLSWGHLGMQPLCTLFSSLLRVYYHTSSIPAVKSPP